MLNRRKSKNQELNKVASPKVTIIILNWNNYKDTAECLRSLTNLSYPNFEVVIVDNGSSDSSPQQLQREFPQHNYILSEVNLGFAGGNNLGIKSALENESVYTLLLNNDTIILEDFLSKLVSVGESSPKVGILGPRVVCTSKPDNLAHGAGFVSMKLGRLVTKDQSLVTECDFVTGACMLVKNTVFQNIGLLDRSYFLYWEDTDICARARKEGFAVIYDPTVRISHKVSKTTRSLEKNNAKLYYFSRNRILFVKNHGNYLDCLILFFISFISFLKSTLRRLVQYSRKREVRASNIISSELLGLIDGWLGRNGVRNR